MNPGTVDALLDPTDHQNVPKAVRLLQAVSSLRNVDGTQRTPSIQQALSALSILGEVYANFIDPMVDVTTNLQKQLEALATTSHLLTYLYRLHGTAFMSGQLYYDIQATIKATFINIAKQRLLDPSQGYYLTQTGTDRLENMFASIRTQTHDRNCDAKELCDRAGRAQEMESIFNANPQWDRGHKRLSLTGAQGIDFINPVSWVGDVCVRNVNLGVAWANGCRNAERILNSGKLGQHAPVANFALLFSSPDVDVCRPNGDGKYPGLSTEIVDAVPEEPVVVESDDTDEEEELEVAIDEALDDLDNLQAPADEVTSQWMQVDATAQRVHKSTIVRLLFSHAGDPKSTDRLKRVRGYTRYSPNLSCLDEESVTPENSFMIGDLFATLVRCQTSLSVAVFSTTAITQHGKQLHCVAVDRVKAQGAAEVTIFGQLLELRAVSQEWFWTGSFAILPPTVTVTKNLPKSLPSNPLISEDTDLDTMRLSTRKISQRLVGYQASGRLIAALNPRIMSKNDAPSEIRDAIQGPSTWVFQETALSQVANLLVSVNADENSKVFPAWEKVSTFPYKKDGA
jgi:hypothetical protein